MLTTKNRLTLYIITGLVLVLIIGAVVLMNTGSGTESVAELLTLGNRFLSELNYEQALVQFLRVIEIEPRNAQGYYGAARAYLGLGQTDNAINILRRGIEMTGDAQLQALLDELTAPPEPEDEALEDTRIVTLTGPWEGVEAPFTPEQRAIVDRITVAMLAEEYEYALELRQMPEIRGMQLAGNRSFVYRDIFWFTFSSDFSSRPVLQMDKTKDGTGIVVSLYSIDRGVFVVHILEHEDGLPNGMREVQEWREGQIDRGHTTSIFNGYYHGERIMHFYSRGYTHIFNYENGYVVILGPPRSDGMVPVGVSSTGGFAYRGSGIRGVTTLRAAPTVVSRIFRGDPDLPRFY